MISISSTYLTLCRKLCFFVKELFYVYIFQMFKKISAIVLEFGEPIETPVSG
jgi:hypothetical protein